jgi:ubiquinone biosynthesis protein UbiJ
VTPLLPNPAERALNHLLRATPVAKERLQRFAGRTVAFHVGPVPLAFTIQTTGEVTAAISGTARDLDVRISPFLLPRLAAREEAAFREVEMQGDPALAEEVAFLARHLRWDVEEDLSKVMGDVAAHRMVSTARTVGGWGRDATQRLAQGAAEYWTEESPLIASRVKLETFTRDVTELRDAVDRLEQRLRNLSDA